MFWTQSSKWYNLICERRTLCSPLELKHYKPYFFQLFQRFSQFPQTISKLKERALRVLLPFSRTYLCKSGLENNSGKLNYTKIVNLWITRDEVKKLTILFRPSPRHISLNLSMKPHWRHCWLSNLLFSWLLSMRKNLAMWQFWPVKADFYHAASSFCFLCLRVSSSSSFC